MAMTISKSPYTVDTAPQVKTIQRVTSLTAGLEEDIAHAGPDGLAPEVVNFMVVTPPTSNDPVSCSWLKDDSNTTNNTIRVKFDTIAGGDLSGAYVEIMCTFEGMASGGITAP